MTEIQATISADVSYNSQPTSEGEAFGDAGYLEDHIHGIEDAMDDRIADLQQQISLTDDPQRKLELEDAIMRLESDFADFEASIQEMASDADGYYSSQYGAVASADNADELESMISDLRQTIHGTYETYGTAQVPCDVEDAKPSWEPVDVDVETRTGVVGTEELEPRANISTDSSKAGNVDRSWGTTSGDGPSSTETSSSSEGTSSSGETSGAEGTSSSGGGDEIDGRTPEEMMNLMSNDPNAYYEELQDMDPEDRQMMMTMVQQQLQEMNQMFQMISQFQQAIHDTQKAVIQNMRV